MLKILGVAGIAILPLLLSACFGGIPGMYGHRYGSSYYTGSHQPYFYTNPYYANPQVYLPAWGLGYGGPEPAHHHNHHNHHHPHKHHH